MTKAELMKWKEENEGMIAVADAVSRGEIGHNNPPDPIDQITEPFEVSRTEAESWLDGTPVENEGQMKAVDELRKAAREWRLALEAGQKSEAAPLHDAWKAALARWKPTIEDAQRIEKGLVALVDTFKRKLSEEKAEAERIARAAADKARREAEEAARKADAADLEAQREAAAKMEAARAAQAEAVAASKDTVKGLRTVTKYEITDHKALLHWIAQNDREAVTAFIDDYAQKNYKRGARCAPGIRVWDEKEAF